MIQHQIMLGKKISKWITKNRPVGNTIFVRSGNIEPILGCKRLFLKFEGGNPSGTQKDRIAQALVGDAIQKGYQQIAVGTCGNLGAAIALAAKDFDIEAHIYIPTQSHTNRTSEIEDKYDGVIHGVDGTYEEAVEICSTDAEQYGWYDANPGELHVTEISLKAYGQISKEIYRTLGYVPDIVSVPVGNGTTLAGIYYGFLQLLKEGKTNKLPKMVAASTLRGNPVVKSFKIHSQDIKDLKPSEIKETSYNEPLVNWHAYDGQIALDAVYESHGFAEYASDTRMLEFSRLLKREEGLNVLPASACCLAVLPSTLKNIQLNGTKLTVVAILTGRIPYNGRHKNNGANNHNGNHSDLRLNI
ncbi:MAG: pyridoxal-phosphate dependent enzyme [Promethearchaeota archaeon]